VNHSARLEQEAPEEEDADDEGEHDEKDFDETHSRFLRSLRARPLSRAAILSAH
jgi:hypothetical protein